MNGIFVYVLKIIKIIIIISRHNFKIDVIPTYCTKNIINGDCFLSVRTSDSCLSELYI